MVGRVDNPSPGKGHDGRCALWLLGNAADQSVGSFCP